MAGFLATAVGAGLDAGTIANIVSQQLQGSGMVANSNGIYTPSSFSSSNFICDASNAATMFDMVQGNNTDQLGTHNSTALPTVTVNPQGVATVVVTREPAMRETRIHELRLQLRRFAAWIHEQAPNSRRNGTERYCWKSRDSLIAEK